MAIFEILADGFNYADEELIRAGGRTYAFTNQWGTNRTFSAINDLIQAFPEHRITCMKSEDEA